MARSGWMLLAVGAVASAACTTVKLAQKDNCWVRRSERWLGGAKEEVGPCAPPAPKWSEDRLTRLMQECVARADYRWQARALEAWNRGDRLPEQTSEEKVLQQCLGEPTRAVLAENEALRGRNEVLQKRVAELSSDRDLARTSEEDARRRLVGGYEKMAEKMTDYLGSAANKAQAPATATASAKSDSEGSAHNESAHDASTSLAAETAPGQPGTVVVTAAPGMGAATPPPPARKARARPRPVVRAEAPACPPSAPAAPGAPSRSEAVWAPVIAPSATAGAAPSASP